MVLAKPKGGKVKIEPPLNPECYGSHAEMDLRLHFSALVCRLDAFFFG